MSAEAKAEGYQNVLGTMEQYLTFKVAGETYGLKLQQVKEIIRPGKITFVPNVKKHITGVMNLRGQIIPVINMQEKLGLDGVSDYSDLKRIIVVEEENYLIGLMVDMVNEATRIKEEEIEEVSEDNIRREYVRGVTRVNDDLIIVLNLINLLRTDSQEKEA